MAEEHGLILAGEDVRTGRTREIKSPYDDSVVGIVHQAGEEEAEEAVRSALSAFETTRSMSVARKAEIVLDAAAAITEHKEELARSIALEAGKPIKTARAEADRTVDTFTFAAQEARGMFGEVIPLDASHAGEGRVGITRRFPLGVILGISPFNFPLNLVAHKMAPVAATGNTFICRPASQTPITALRLGRLLVDAGLPAGALSVLPCPVPVAEKMVGDDRIKMLTFTGSGDVGWALRQRAGKKKVTLELGGNAGVIIDADAPFEYALGRTVTGAYSYAGQSCISVQRIFIHRDIYDEFVAEFVKRVNALKVGDPLDEETDVGPLITSGDAERIEAWIDEAVKEGAELLAGGGREGSLMQPAVLADISKSMKLSCVEAFGPVCGVQPFDDFYQVLEELNDSVYGLQAGVFTRDMGKVMRAFEELEVGGLMVNDVPTYRVDNMPYGGVKESGMGREGPRYAMEEMTELKLMAIDMAAFNKK